MKKDDDGRDFVSDLFRGDASTGGRGARKETRTRSGRSEAHVHRREESSLERELR